MKILPVFSSKRQLARLRREKRIPHLRISERVVLYDLNAIREWLRKMEVS
jgi:hypothetical protein